VRLKETLERIFKPPEPAYEPLVKPGLHHYMREADGTYTRFHLRAEPDGRGMLLANAALAARLSPSGVLIAKGILDGNAPTHIKDQLRDHFRGASVEMMDHDLERVGNLIATLASPGDNYPIINLEDAAVSPFEARLIAPLQANLPLMPPEQMGPILDKLWEIALPNVTIVLGEDPIHEHLVRAVERAEDLGMIAGARTRASALVGEDLLERLAMAGIDYVSVFYASHLEEVHDRYLGAGDHRLARELFPQLQRAEIATAAVVPLLTATQSGLRRTLTDLLDMGVYSTFFFAIAGPDDMSEVDLEGALAASALPQAADLVEELSDFMDVRFIWQAPVMREPDLPIERQVRQGARCSDEISMLVTAEGQVVPPRGPFRSAGNLLSDDWDTIWHHGAFRRYRDRVEQPTRCNDCPGMALCAADCPREMAGWSSGSGEVAP
jgi:radical SAM protein with 4Fe4S-binding SPASM domain